MTEHPFRFGLCCRQCGANIYFAFQSLKYKLKGNDYRGSLILICSKSHLNITKCVDSAPKSQLRPPWKQRQRQGIIKRLLPSPALKHWEGVNIQSTHSSHKISNFTPAQPSPAPAASTCNSLVLGLGHRSHHRASNKTKYISHNTDRHTVKLGLHFRRDSQPPFELAKVSPGGLGATAAGPAKLTPVRQSQLSFSCLVVSSTVSIKMLSSAGLCSKKGRECRDC